MSLHRDGERVKCQRRGKCVSYTLPLGQDTKTDSPKVGYEKRRRKKEKDGEWPPNRPGMSVG